MHFDAAIAAVQLKASGPQFGQGKNGLLQTSEQGGGKIFGETRVVQRRIVGVLQQLLDVRLGLLSPGGEQAVSRFVMSRRASQGKCPQPLRVDDVEPVFAAGIQHIEGHIDPAGESAEHGEIQRWHVRQTKYVHRPRQIDGIRTGFGGLEAAQKMAGRMLRRRAQPGTDASPEFRLPRLIVDLCDGGFWHRNAVADGPRVHPVLAIRDVLFEQRRDVARQLEAHGLIRVFEIVLQPRKLGPGRLLQ